jgi:hypothetical protein
MLIASPAGLYFDVHQESYCAPQHVSAASVSTSDNGNVR